MAFGSISRIDVPSERATLDVKANSWYLHSSHPHKEMEMANGTRNTKSTGNTEKPQKHSSPWMTPRQAYLVMVRKHPRGMTIPKKEANGKENSTDDAGLFFNHYDALKAAGEYDCALACATRISMCTWVTEKTIRYFKEAAKFYLALGCPERALAMVEMAERKGARNIVKRADAVYRLLMIRVDALDLMNRVDEADKAYDEAKRYVEEHRNVIPRDRLTHSQRSTGTLPASYIKTY